MTANPGGRAAEKRAWRRDVTAGASTEVDPYNPYAQCRSLLDCPTTCVYVGQGCSGFGESSQRAEAYPAVNTSGDPKCSCGVFVVCTGQSRYDTLTGKCFGYHADEDDE